MDVAVIGGGRWARVHLSVLAASGLPIDRVTMVTRHTASTAIAAPFSVEMVASIGDLKAAPVAAIVANAAHDHAHAAQQLLERGVHVLVEKPVVLKLQEAQELVALARQNSRVLLPGLNYRFCSYVQHFVQQLQHRQVNRVAITWADPAAEMRYGETKRHDANITLAEDVMSHIWALLSQLFPAVDFVPSAMTQLSSHHAQYGLEGNGIHAEIELARESDRRRRFIQVTTVAGEVLALDFATEPGEITIDGVTANADPQWATSPSPLLRQLRYFFECIAHGRADAADEAALLKSVQLTEAVSQLLPG